MPCHVELTEAEKEAERRARTEREIAAVVKPLMERNDQLTHENDMLRETILNLVGVLGSEAEDLIDTELLERIEKNQVEHRKEDLRRLDDTLRQEMWDHIQKHGPEGLTDPFMLERQALMVKVHSADPNYPLEAQLGFDPDEY